MYNIHLGKEVEDWIYESFVIENGWMFCFRCRTYTGTCLSCHFLLFIKIMYCLEIEMWPCQITFPVILMLQCSHTWCLTDKHCFVKHYKLLMQHILCVKEFSLFCLLSCENCTCLTLYSFILTDSKSLWQITR